MFATFASSMIFGLTLAHGLEQLSLPISSPSTNALSAESIISIYNWTKPDDAERERWKRDRERVQEKRKRAHEHWKRLDERAREQDKRDEEYWKRLDERAREQDKRDLEQRQRDLR